MWIQKVKERNFYHDRSDWWFLLIRLVSDSKIYRNLNPKTRQLYRNKRIYLVLIALTHSPLAFGLFTLGIDSVIKAHLTVKIALMINWLSWMRGKMKDPDHRARFMWTLEIGLGFCAVLFIVILLLIFIY